MIAGVTAAQAADLPVAPEPIDYVRVCDAFGTGFYYIPGTETCLRVGGKVRVDFYFNNYGDAPSNWSDRTANATETRARGYLRLDARTNSEYGLVRAYMDTWVTSDSPHGNATVELYEGYIQFGNFTFGKTQSFFDFYTGYSYGASISDYTDAKTWSAAYTAAFGNGFSATVAIEDATTRRADLISPVVNGYAGHRWPNLVANLRVDQGWGSAQIMGAVHEVRFLDATASGQVGWAIAAGVEFNVPFFGTDDAIAFQVGYSDGASNFPMNDWDGLITDAVFNGVSTKTTKTINFAAGYNHNFNEKWEANLEGGYHIADALGSAFDFSQWGLNANVVWKPIEGLGIGAEVAYRQVDYKTATGLADKDEIYTTLRIEREF
ncbi:porin [Polymorphum gilvum]|nr:porin [Polymorphum gilvum]